MTQARADDRVVRVVLKNATNEPARLCLRPCGGIFDMAAGVSYELRARGPATDLLTIELGNGEVVVDGWSHSDLSVHTFTVKRQRGAQSEELAPSMAPAIALELRGRLQGVDRAFGGLNDFDDDEPLG